MSSIVLELQRDAIRSDVSTLSLLRKALVVAKKLDLDEFNEWIDHELNGWRKNVPDYRIVPCEVRALDPYAGWKPVVIQEVWLADELSKRACVQPVGELEALLLNGSDGMLLLALSQEIQNMLAKGTGYDVKFIQATSKIAVAGILDAVRNALLNWAIRLEKDGIFGEGMVFDKVEQSTASKQHYSVANFYGPVSNSQVQAGSVGGSQKAEFGVNLGELGEMLNALESGQESLHLPDDEASELEAEIATIRSQAGGACQQA